MFMVERTQLSFFFKTIFFFLLILHGVQLMPLFAQEKICNLSLKVNPDDPLGYRMLDDWCEGRYVQQVASTTLVFASFTEYFEDFNSNSGQNLRIEWSPLPGKNTVRLRGQAIKPQKYYRMDASLPSFSGRADWNTDRLAALNLARQDIGVNGWTTHSIAGVEREIYTSLFAFIKM